MSWYTVSGSSVALAARPKAQSNNNIGSGGGRIERESVIFVVATGNEQTNERGKERNNTLTQILLHVKPKRKPTKKAN